MNIEIGTKVLSNDEVMGIPWNTEGRVTHINDASGHPYLYEVVFGDKLRYLYHTEFFVVEE